MKFIHVLVVVDKKQSSPQKRKILFDFFIKEGNILVTITWLLKNKKPISQQIFGRFKNKGMLF